MHRNSLLSIAATAAMALAIVTPAAAQFRAAPPPNTNVPGTPNYPESEPSTYHCTDQLGYLRRVYTSELDAVEDHTQVWVTPICVGEDRVFRSDGNAGALRGAIAANEAMQIALSQKAFGPDDVVGVRMIGEDTVTLYVHPFHH